MQAKGIAPLKRTGLQRLVCLNGCGCTVYMTMSQVEAGKFPTCSCEGMIVPEHPELAAKVLPQSVWHLHPWLAEYARQCQSIQHGQASHIQRGRQVRSDLEIAGERVAKAMVSEARERRLSGIRQQVAVEMPF